MAQDILSVVCGGFSCGRPCLPSETYRVIRAVPGAHLSVRIVGPQGDVASQGTALCGPCVLCPHLCRMWLERVSGGECRVSLWVQIDAGVWSGRSRWPSRHRAWRRESWLVLGS